MKKLIYILLILPLYCFPQHFPGSISTTGEGTSCRAGQTTILPLISDPGFFRASEHGIVGDSVTDNTDSIQSLFTTAKNYFTTTGKATTIYFKEGEYLTDTFAVTTPEFLIRGKSKHLTNIINSGKYEEMFFCNMRSITVTGFSGGDFYCSGKSLKFESVKFQPRMGDVGRSAYFHLWGFYSNLKKVVYSKCNFIFDSVYMGVEVYNKGVDTFYFDHNTMSCNAGSHLLRVEIANDIKICDNVISGGVTGIMFGSTRTRPIQNAIVSGNEVYGQSEEGITCDGFGNNTGLCPVIANGSILSASNDVNGRLVISSVLAYSAGSHPTQYTDTMEVADRSDWTKFYYSFSEGSGLPGRYFQILSFDTTAGTFTLDTICPASAVTLGGWGSVDGGFFNITFTDNYVHDVWGVDSTYGTGFSIYLNCFNVEMSGNRMVNCAHGANVTGGLMLGIYRTKAWRINIHDNIFDNNPEYGITIGNLYSTDIKGYDNLLKDNTFRNAPIIQNTQVNFTNTGNIILP